MTRILVIGADIGQKRDPTAIAVAEIGKREDEQGREETHFVVPFLGRLPLGTPYPEVARRIAEIADSVHHRTGGQARVYVYLDATGVGQPVVDLVAERRIQASLLPVYFTHGDRRSQDTEKVTLGKAYLVSRLQALLQSRRVRWPDGAETRTLAQELKEYEIKVSEDANDRYGAFRVGTHDDLVTALGLAVQTDQPKPLKPLVVRMTIPNPPGL
jgi:hypothetical protein